MTEASASQDQVRVWNDWNTGSKRESVVGQPQREQSEVVEGWIDSAGSGQRPRDILEVGCGTGWMCERLRPYGSVTGIDLADEVIDRASERIPGVTFVAGDLLQADLGRECFDVVVALETMAHFEDQAGFLRRMHDLLRPGGYLMLGAQNRPMMERNIAHLPARGWYRRWVDHVELRELVETDFDVVELRSITPKFFEGPLHVLNSEKVENLVRKVGLRPVLRRIKRFEEDRWMGWTLMCLARKPI